jgi:ATP-binding cassette subfamily C protein
LLAYAGFRLVPSANRITAYLNVMRGAGVYIRDVYEDFVTLGAVDPTPMPAAAQADPARAFRTAVVFERVSYRYEDRSAPALDDVSLTIRKGESIGIVGQTGAGKSTFVDLLLGLLHPMSGRIVVDGVELGADARWWQRQLGYVPQTFAMIDDTLRRNIAFGFADREIDEQRLGAAVRMAQLDDVVAALPQALDTNMGERGIRLSGGQRQRIAIARALYRNPDVLIFDEATSSLDNQTEAEITRAIEALHHRLTVVVITHRLSTVRSCDRLVFLQGGRITAIGTFDQLVDTNAEFRAMATTTV